MEKVYEMVIPGKKEGELYLNCCGGSTTESLPNFGPAVKPYYMIHFILSGKGTFVTGTKEFSIREGQGFLTMPGEICAIRADGDDPWSGVWVGFSGDKSTELVQNMGLTVKNPVFKSKRSDEIFKTVKDMMEYNTYEMCDELHRNGQLSVFLSIIAESTMATDRKDTDRASHYVRKAIEYIQCNYCDPIKVSNIAEFVRINRSYLYTIFMNSIGISPQQFLATFRIIKAAELLQYTNLPIESVALSCGYVESLVFTKAFKQMKGISPSLYRKEVRNSSTGKCVEENNRQVEELIEYVNKLELAH